MREYMIALYIRLSLEDFKTESLSIGNQRLYLLEHAITLPEYDNAEILEFIDNGYSGANFERPAVQELLDLPDETRRQQAQQLFSTEQPWWCEVAFRENCVVTIRHAAW